MSNANDMYRGIIVMPLETAKPFFPDDKPRSWVIAVSAGILGLPLGLITFIAGFCGFTLLFDVLRSVFAVCGLVMVLMMIIFQANSLTGQYKDFKASKWRDRPW